jgi:hypothetical protein
MSTCRLSVVITMSEQVVPSAVAQCIVVKFLNNKNVKLVEILMKLRARFDNKTLSRTQCISGVKSLTEGRKEIENIQRLHTLQGQL